MKNYKPCVLLAVLFFISNSIFGQEERVTHFGFYINPKYTIQIFDLPNMVEGENTFNYSFGLDFYYDISSDLQFRTGLSYFQLDSDEVDFSLIFACDLDINGESNIKDSRIEDNLRLHYVGLPIGIKDKLFGKENYAYLNPAVEVYFRVSDSNESVLVECGTNETRLTMGQMFNPRNIYFNSRLGIGYEFGVLKKARLFFEPSFEYSLNRLLDRDNLLSFDFLI